MEPQTPSASSTSSFEPNAQRTTRAWAITLVVVALVEVVALALSPEAPIAQGLRFYLAGTHPNHTQSMVQWQTERMRGLEEPAELLVVGDSSALMGFIPREIEQRVGMRTENLAMIQPLGLEGQVDMLEFYLQHHPPPRLIVFQFSEPNLSLTEEDLERYAMLDGFQTWIGHRDQAVDVWPTTRLRGLARAAVGGSWYEESTNDKAIREFMVLNNGYFREPEARMDWAKPPAPPESGVSPEAAAQLKRLFELTKRSGAPLWLRHAPIPEAFRSPEHDARIAADERTVRALAASQPHVRVIGPWTRYAPVEYFFDYQHLLLDGALINSVMLTRSIDALFKKAPSASPPQGEPSEQPQPPQP